MSGADKYGMSSNALQVITNALARLGVVGANRIPSEADQELGLQTLQDMLRRFIRSGALGTHRTVTPTGSYTAGENEHIFRNSIELTSVTLPELVDCGSGYMDDYGDCVPSTKQRTPKDGAFVIITDVFTNDTE